MRGAKGTTVGDRSVIPAKTDQQADLAADYLFIFLLHEGMEPTNNSVEREIRYPVIHRKVRGQIGSKEMMSRFGSSHAS